MRLIIAVFMMFLFVLAGCSSAGNPNDPVSPGTQAGVRELTDNSTHMPWGYYEMHVSDDHSSIEVIPQRMSAMHLNARTFLEESPCTDCLSIDGIVIKPGWIMEVDITLRHPFQGVTVYTGFDVRGIAIFDGSHAWPSSGLVMSRSDAGDIELLNPDGYTRLFNPTEYAPGSGAGPIHEYSKGKYAPFGNPSATLNGYINYYSEEERRYFLPGDAIQHTYEIQAQPGGFVFGYAIDASWLPPQGSPPYYVPDDFPAGANCAEGYQYSIAYEPGMKSDGSGVSLITVDVYDWQDPAGVVSVEGECPDVFTGVKIFNHAEDGEDYARYRAVLVNTLGATAGNYDMLVWATDVNDASDVKHLVAYAITTIEVQEEITVPEEPTLITVIEDVFNSPFCAKVDTQSDKCYVDSTQLSPTFDISIRSIDDEENVENFFFKSFFMGGCMGLNPDTGKLISPDFITDLGNVDFLDLTGAAHKNFFVPLYHPDGIAFLYDGEIFTSPSKACVDDGASQSLIIWDYTEPSPDYGQVSTGGFPTALEGDYENDRVFVYCFGNQTTVTPEINVIDMVAEEMITSLAVAHTDTPFWTDMDYDPVGDRLYLGAGTSPGYIEVWDMDTYEHITSIETTLDEVHGLTYMDGMVYVTGQIESSGKLLVVDPELEYVVFELDCGSDPVMLDANPNNKKIYVPDIGGSSVWIWQAY